MNTHTNNSLRRWTLGFALISMSIISNSVKAQSTGDDYADRFRICIENSYTGNDHSIDSDSLSRAIEIITEGVEKYPNRIDLRNAKITALIAKGCFKESREEVCRFIEQSKTNSFQWDTYNGKTYDMEMGKQVAINSYSTFANLYRNFPQGEGENYLAEITDRFLELVPGCVEALNFKAISCMDSEPNKALNYLFQAQKQSPDDIVIISNIMTTYYLERNIGEMNYWVDILKSMPEVPKDFNTLADYLQAQPMVCLNKEGCQILNIKENGDGTNRAEIIASIKNPSDVPAFLSVDVDLYVNDKIVASSSQTPFAIADGICLQQSKMINISSDLKDFTVVINLMGADGSPIESYAFNQR